MSVETPKVVEETPVPVKTVPVAAESATATAKIDSSEKVEPTAAPVATLGNTEGTAPTSATEQNLEDNKVAIAATPASEGTLGYKAPGFLKSFVFSKQHFWLGEEASTPESLTSYISNAKADGHHHAAWAQETGKGVLFHTKRSEDKATPAGMILLSEASTLIKEGPTEFSFMVGKKHHKFEAQTTAERDSWIVAIEKAIEESKAIKEEVTGRPSYKSTLEGYGKSATPLVAAGTTSKTERSVSKGPKKSLDAATATAAASEPVAKEEAASVSSSEKEQQKAEKAAAKKERSQSRKRASIFGLLNKKDEDKEVKKEEKAEKKYEKEIKKEEKEHIKEDKKAEAEAKKEEAKATHDSSKAVEAAEAAAVAAVPAAAVAAADKKEETTETAPTDKKNKRASVFGNLFAKKNVTSPTAEKTENQAIAPPATTSEVPPVSETAPKLDEPIENKPIDTAAVTAPVDTTSETPFYNATTLPADPSAPHHHSHAAPATEAVVTPKTEKKGGFLGFMKKAETKKEAKEEVKAEKATEPVVAEPVTTTATEATPEAAVVDSPAVAANTEVAKEERPAREKRRSSFFGSLGTMKKRNPEASEADNATPDVKRERSPLPGKLGGLFRKPSKAVKPTETEAATDAKVETPAASTEVPANATVVEPTESRIVGDVVPDDLHADTTAPVASETKTSV